MQHRRHISVLRLLCLCAVTLMLTGSVALFAQNDNNSNSGNNSGSNNNSTGTGNTTGTGGTGTTSSTGTLNDPRSSGGVFVDANGVLSRYSVLDIGQLNNRQLSAAKASYAISGDISARSSMRCVSLNRLEKAIIEAGGTMTDDMLYLAGIQQIRYVFYFPESKDIVIAGPAEGWFPYEGTMVGRQTLQPVCELQDLVAALRAYAPNKEMTEIVGCSIDPTAEGNVRLQQFQGRFSGTNRKAFVQGIRDSIGMQTVRVDGVPATTHAAQMMVAADYRMKRIGLGMDRSPVRGLETFVSRTAPSASNAVFRWFFVPDYDSVNLTEDRTALELVGEGVKLVGENEIVSFSTGERTAVSGTLDPGTRAFTQSFTRLYPRIADNVLVFAQLRNWIDMLICAAHIQKENFYGQADWSMEFFGSEEKYPLETYTAPKEVAPLVGQAVRRNILLAPVGGGIVIDAEQALKGAPTQTATSAKISEKQKSIAISLPKGVWWWDVQ